jgi:hypothetical protein
MFAIDHEPTVAMFQRETGVKLVSAPRNGLEAMIDAATGAGEHRMMAFVLWVTKNIWGRDGVPDEILARLDEVTDSPGAAATVAKSKEPRYVG